MTDTAAVLLRAIADVGRQIDTADLLTVRDHPPPSLSRGDLVREDWTKETYRVRVQSCAGHVEPYLRDQATP
jgi:hypothetical protein